MMRYIFLFSLSLFLYSVSMAQDKMNPEIFPDPVVVAPDPPKSIKGWKMQDYEGDSVLVGEYPGKILKFQFEGSAVGVAVVSGMHSGIIEYSVDNYPWQKQDLYVSGQEQVSYFTLESNLKPRKHMLQIRLTEEKNPASNGTKCVLKAFYFNAK